MAVVMPKTYVGQKCLCCLSLVSLVSEVCTMTKVFVCVCVQATATVEVDLEKAEKLQVCRTDFMGSLNNDIKPVSNITALLLLLVPFTC